MASDTSVSSRSERRITSGSAPPCASERTISIPSAKPGANQPS